MMTKEWFSSWFDSPYYHILYKERDDKEAQLFMDQLSSYLQIQPEHHIMDLACGKGRHAIYLNQKGFEVTGVDLSPQSIAFAKIYENAHLHFLCTICVKFLKKDISILS
jgi:cyclopropane fatty-acyl-phospholipid synthase-like methyltransferase